MNKTLKVESSEVAMTEVILPLLQKLTRPYIHNKKVPKLPFKPDGSLFDVGYLFDEDKDERILCAIEILVRNGITPVCVSESKGRIDIYDMVSHPYIGISPYTDYWYINYYIPYGNEWSKVKEVDFDTTFRVSNFLYLPEQKTILWD